MINPWITMRENTERRVDINFNYDLFWIVDLDGRYGFCIKSKAIFDNVTNNINLKGITVKRILDSADISSLYLILNKKEDCEIFLALCQDLINTANRYDDNEKIILEVEERLKRWQQLLKNNNYDELTIERQMGLFSELVCLKNIVAEEVGIREAVISWVGPDFDKQDFLMDSAVIEVKSYRSSKGEVVSISSLQQLESPKTPLYLVAYGLTTSERGLSALDIIESINKQIDDEWIREKFENKLFEYGFINGISNKHRLYKFIVDSEKVYSISNLFPRIQRKDVMGEIVSVKYSIDLSQCTIYETNVNKIFKEGGVA